VDWGWVLGWFLLKVLFMGFSPRNVMAMAVYTSLHFCVMSMTFQSLVMCFSFPHAICCLYCSLGLSVGHHVTCVCWYCVSYKYACIRSGIKTQWGMPNGKEQIWMLCVLHIVVMFCSL
jgi:hypothetical protein